MKYSVRKGGDRLKLRRFREMFAGSPIGVDVTMPSDKRFFTESPPFGT